MKKILIVDDEPEVIKLVGALLQKIGYECIFAVNGQEGLKAAHENKPDLIIVDYSMPQMDGLTFMKECRSAPSLDKVPIIALTANENAEFDFINSGANEFMAKPINSDELIDKINNAFTGKKKKGLFGFFK